MQATAFCHLDDAEPRVLCAAVDAKNPHGGQCIASEKKALGFRLWALAVLPSLVAPASRRLS
jgi:hypothetical protein